ncbi:pyridoxal 5'-phosphate synthase [Actinoplanes sp. CA-030573]|uniref:pyridoxal 5'-phosphate synthase n=1 Tax=Actinoplanes sp. CA-030573 TaxID=3239898 RepID=UPI003D8E53D8
MMTFSGDTTLRLAEFDAPPRDPIVLLRSWLDTATERGVREPYAMTLATVAADGTPSTRVVLLKAVDHGLVFGTQAGSRKGTDLAARPVASVTFHWRETVQQINVAGPVRRLDDAASDRLFADRPAAARATTAASAQSRPLDSEDRLRRRAAALLKTGVSRPGDWFAYRLEPAAIEFWQGSDDRLHRRLRYDRAPEGWRPCRLQP